MKQTKKELVEKIKAEVKPYAIPERMDLRSKEDLEAIYQQAQELGLTKEGQ